jgi:ribosome biogenesis GTPase / thiamine phosphate phosphatase
VPETTALTALGWTAELDRAFAAAARQGDLPGRIARIDRGGWVDVLTDRGELRGRKHPRFRRLMDPLDAPAVGDWAVLRPDPGGGPTLVQQLLPRSTALIRTAGDAEESRTQLVAANVDLVAIVVPADLVLNVRRLDRLLAVAHASGARPLILLTKIDACAGPAAAIATVRAEARDVAVLPLSARTGEGLGAVEALLGPGRTLVLLGTSGAGKSTLANRLLGEELLATTEVRGDGAGRHTTTYRQLVVLPGGGLLIDTPGVRSIGTWEGEEADGDEGAERSEEEQFADVEALIAACRFGDCSHGPEPGCAVRAALDAGELDPERWDRYRTIETDREERARRRAATARAAETRRSRAARARGRRSGR